MQPVPREEDHRDSSDGEEDFSEPARDMRQGPYQTFIRRGPDDVESIHDDEAEKAKPGGVTWLAVSWVMLSDLVGTSVLTYGGVARDLGWVPTITCIVVLVPVSIYTAVLMSRSRALIAQRTLGKGPQSMAECSGMLCKNPTQARRATNLTYLIVYGFGLLGQGSYLQTLGKALQGALYDTSMCLPVATLVSCACLVPFVVRIRRLRDSVPICFANLFLILAIIAICAGRLLSDGRKEGAETHYVAPGLTFMTLFGSATNVLYSFSGHWIYFEIMDEMAKPTDFPLVFSINAPLQLVLYMFVAAVGYWYGGDNAKSNFVDNIPAGGLYRAVSIMLFGHVMVAYVIKGVVVARYLHDLISPGANSDSSVKAQVVFGLISIGQLAFGFLVANLVPFFSDLLGLIGGLLGSPIGYLMPCAFYVLAMRQSGQSIKSGPQVLVMVCVCLLALFTMVVGTIQEIKDIVKKDGKYGLPFDCHLWNVDAN